MTDVEPLWPADPRDEPQHNKGNGPCPPGRTTDITVPAEFSDEAIALQFTETHSDKLRYAAAWGKWLLWNRSRWEFDETLRAFDFSRATCRAVSSGAPKKLATGIASARTVAGIISLARADRRHAATVDQWDAGDWTFNPPTIGDNQ